MKKEFKAIEIRMVLCGQDIMTASGGAATPSSGFDPNTLLPQGSMGAPARSSKFE